MKQKGEIIDIATFVDEFKNKCYRITIEFEKRPELKLGKCEVEQ